MSDLSSHTIPDEDDIEAAISDSINLDWTPRVAAKAVMRIMPNAADTDWQRYVDANEARLDCIGVLKKVADARMPGEARRIAIKHLMSIGEWRKER